MNMPNQFYQNYEETCKDLLDKLINNTTLISQNESERETRKQITILSRLLENRKLYFADMIDQDKYYLLNQEFDKITMQNLITKYFKWNNWSEIHWHSYDDFVIWINNIEDNAQALWAINNTSLGRFFLGLLTSKYIREKYNFQKMLPQELLVHLGLGYDNFLWLQSVVYLESIYHFGYFYSMNALPSVFINELIIKGNNHPLNAYRQFIISMYCLKYAITELDRRCLQDPVLSSTGNYLFLNLGLDKFLTEIIPGRVTLPSKDIAWKNLEAALEQSGLGALKSEYKESYIKGNKIDYLGFPGEIGVTAEEGILEGIHHWEKKPIIALLIAVLSGHLRNSLLVIARNNLIDYMKQNQPLDKRMVKNLMKKSEDLDQDQDVSFEQRQNALRQLALEMDLRTKQEDESDETIDLSKLNLPLNRLSIPEQRVLLDMLVALNDGYDFNSKQGKSFRCRWGLDYGKNMKTFERIKIKCRNNK